MATTESVSIVSIGNHLLAAVRFSIASQLRQPVLIVSSLDDRLVDYRCSRELAQTWYADYVEHERAGHDLPLDEPEWLTSIIKQWLAV